MKKVGQFEKVSYEQFYQAIDPVYRGFGTNIATASWWKKLVSNYPHGKINPVQVIQNDEERDAMCLSVYENLQLPTRATTQSAGYDFKSPFSFVLEAGATIKIPTGVRVKIKGGWWLSCVPRSSLGFKYRIQLDNTIGVIDGDYYRSDNEGHIFLKITNDSKEGKTLTVQQGEGIMQGIFLPFGITYDDEVAAVRNGGFGSTN